jgi:hypothetical protein
MRTIILVTGAALALAACGNNGQAGNTANIDGGLTAEDIVSNDVTAIDAVTGADANMAADVDVSFTNELVDNLENAATPTGPSSRPATRPGPEAETPAANEAAGNETANAADE